jgi:hypothetical protein
MKTSENTMTWRLKAGKVERSSAVIARQRHGKHASAKTNKHPAIEDAVFCMRSLLRPAKT